MIEVKDLAKMIQGKKVLSGVNFALERGKILGIVGRNGAGKTTLLRLMVGILRPTAGDVLLEGKSIFSEPKLKENMMFVPDSSDALKSYSAKEVAKLYEAIYPKFDSEYFYSLLERFQLPEMKRIGNFSKGMKALFSLILAFSTRANYILLDEPTDGLDVIAKRKVLRFILEEVAEQEASVIISSHRLDELEFMADQILVIKDGEIESNYSLDILKENYKKVQVVFKDYLPEKLTGHVTILQQTGRVYILLLEGDLAKVEQEIQGEDPLLFEDLTVSLEDIFVAKLGGEDYDG